ncbi:hypothetical protein SAMN05421771_3057 [Granulicella pectinivorans]|uniref:Uncharacterized protein n=2 Tax=Granulicella pectinivorans TaxID=474950 RepID=A0A1I6MN54_9BACT|nr:hypothetical protein SAMN05421771_3057 [Granulicella pectinivorans]
MRMSRKTREVLLAAVLPGMLAAVAVAQKAPSAPAPVTGVPAPLTLPSSYNPYDDPTLRKGASSTGDPLEDKRLAYLRSHQAVLDRQKALTRESAQLLRMANELQANAGKGDTRELQETMLRQIEKIEQLARSLKERAKGEKL